MALSSFQVEEIFHSNFLVDENTQLIGGFDEPEYFPASTTMPAQIHYRADYVQSALHEVAHWCVAGALRRQQIDYGYWYAPDGRDAEQQREFYLVESRPQALEWLFSSAAGILFRPSIDNLDMENGQVQLLPDYFVEHLKQNTLHYLNNKEDSREMKFTLALQKATGSALVLEREIIEARF